MILRFKNIHNSGNRLFSGKIITGAFTLSILLSLTTSCFDEREDIDISDVTKTARFRRFDQALFTSDTGNFAAELNKLSEEYPEFFVAGTNLRFWKSQRLDADQLKLYSDAREVFNDLEPLNKNLNFSMKHFYYFFPDHPQVTFYAYISNLDFQYPVLFADTVCFAALDLYLGPGKPYYGSLPEYQAWFRQPAFLVRDCMEAVVKSRVPHKTEAATLLDEMIYHGKILYAVERMMPQKDETIIVQYPKDKLEFCRKNERSIWAYFIEQKALFDTSQDLKRRFTELAPFSKFRMKYDHETPGMIGRWVGWQIVRRYMAQNPKVTLPEMLAEKDSRKILKLSGYKP